MTEYIRRVNRVIDYIENHIAGSLTLDELADVANFSRFHFHRIFSAVVGESLYQFILRLRLERAARKLVLHPGTRVTEIAMDCGFSSPAVFARAFRDRFGVSATTWRRTRNASMDEYLEDFSKNHQLDDKMCKAADNLTSHLDPGTGQRTWRLEMSDGQLSAVVRVEEMEAFTVAYVRHIGPYQGDEALFEKLFMKLMTWGESRGLVDYAKTRFISLYHDDPSTTDEGRLRLTVGMSIPDGQEVEGEIGKMVVEGGRYAVGNFEVATHEYPLAWKAMYTDWLPESGYMPADMPPFELYLNDPSRHPEHKHIFEIWMPVVPL